MTPVAVSDVLAARQTAVPPQGSSPDGAQLEWLRAGQADETPLFMVPGLEGDPDELAALACGLIGPQGVCAILPLLRDAEQRSIVSIERMAELMVAAIRRVQPSGPYRLGGYSLGALIAFEMAQQLRATGDAVEGLFLIEPVYDERYWPRVVWLQALGRRTRRHLSRVVRMHPAKGIGEFRVRAVSLIQRVIRRIADTPDLSRVDACAEATMRRRAQSALAGYRPRFFQGRVVLIAASIDRHFGCDTVRLWRGYADHVDIQRIDADHVTIMHGPAAAAVANVIDHRLAVMKETWTGLRPMPGFERPMILTTVRWFSVARLAHALTEAGFSVSACRPKAHVLELVEGLNSDARLSRVRPLRSLVKAIRQADPDIILPDDERALVLLRRLYSRTQAGDPRMATLIARSLGAVEHWPSITSRTGLSNEAARSGVLAPVTRVIANVDALRTWAAEQSLPIVLKTDGSFGGRGVAIIRKASDLHPAWRRISHPPGLIRSLTRTLIKSDTSSLATSVRRIRPVVNAQQFVNGREAIATVACADGEVRAMVCLEVVHASEPKGPAAVVRIIDHPAMAEAAQRLVARFGLSGFCGLDFMITDAGDAQLLELNPRVTPTCHLLVEGDYARSRIITLFPSFPSDHVRAEPGPDISRFLDLPTRAPSLIHAGERMAARKRRPVSQLASRLKEKFSPLPY